MSLLFQFLYILTFQKINITLYHSFVLKQCTFLPSSKYMLHYATEG